MVKKLCIMLLVIGWGVSVSTMHAMLRIPCALFAARLALQQRHRQAIIERPNNTNIRILKKRSDLLMLGLSSKSQEETLQEHIGEPETPVSQEEREEDVESIQKSGLILRCLR